MLYLSRLSGYSHIGVFAILLYALAIFKRGDTGSDTLSYRAFFDNNVYIFIEPGFEYVSLIVHLFSDDFIYVLFLQSILVFISLFILLKNNSSSVVMFYIATFGTTFDFSTIRQSLAFHLFVLIYFITKKRFLLFISSLFHFSSLFYVIPNILNQRFMKYIMFAMTPGIFYYANIYLSEAPQFVDISLSNIVQFLFLYFIFYLLNSSARTLFALSLFIIPIGFRLFSYAIITENSFSRRKKLRFEIAHFLLFIYCVLKIFSFSYQSIILDEMNSPVHIFPVLN